MNILTYKDYQGSVMYEDGALVIQILHIEDFISTTVEAASEVEAAFHDLVDDYLQTCAELGREPKKPYKGSLNVRLPQELHRKAAMAAVTTGVSLNAWIVEAITSHIDAEESPPAKHVSVEYGPTWFDWDTTGSISHKADILAKAYYDTPMHKVVEVKLAQNSVVKLDEYREGRRA
ncbi:type II toxin-antitoxin system HicB family antitoxin [Ferrovibrio sp.]|uniref:type II toxin-antitoxin system HicB family antitoxin n=1 Tax=Ferrovibrio sp. TaxID=1917215 RepID=UPI003120358B